MTGLTLYIIIGLIFAVIGYLNDSFGPKHKENEKKTEELLDSSLINMTIAQVRSLTFVLNLLMWPLALVLVIADIITGNEDDD